ncbi:MAG: hypothetical protein OHK0024_24410 [Thalassobaculales bacterium]
MAKYWRNKVLLAKVETIYGTDSSPTGAANAIQATDVQLRPMEGGEVRRNLDRGFMGSSGSLLVNLHVALSFKVEMAGAGTAGTAPAYGPLLRACGMSEVLVTGTGTIQNSPPTSTGAPTGTWTYTRTTAYAGTEERTVTLTCTTGGGSGTAEFTVSAPAVGVAPAYNQTGVVMTDATPFNLPSGAQITPTIGTGFEIGDTYTILLTPPEARYRPVSTGFESATLYVNIDGVRHAMLGCRGNAKIEVKPGDIPRYAFDLLGLLVAATDTALPTPVLTAWQAPKTVSDANTPTARLNGVDVVLESFEADLGQKVEGRFLVNHESIQITDREGGGRLMIEAVPLATLDPFALAVARTRVPITLTHGTASGAIVHVEHPRAELGRPGYSQSQGIAMWDIAYEAVAGDSGNDEIAVRVR